MLVWQDARQARTAFERALEIARRHLDAEVLIRVLSECVDVARTEGAVAKQRGYLDELLALMPPDPPERLTMVERRCTLRAQDDPIGALEHCRWAYERAVQVFGEFSRSRRQRREPACRFRSASSSLKISCWNAVLLPALHDALSADPDSTKVSPLHWPRCALSRFTLLASLIVLRSSWGNGRPPLDCEPRMRIARANSPAPSIYVHSPAPNLKRAPKRRRRRAHATRRC